MRRVVRLKGKMDAGKMYQAGIDFQDQRDVLDLTIRGRNRVTGRIDALVIKLPPNPKRVHLIAHGGIVLGGEGRRPLVTVPMPRQGHSVRIRRVPARRTPRRSSR